MNRFIIQKYNLHVLNENVHSPEHSMRINGGGRGEIHTVRTVSIYNEKIVEREANRYLKTHKYMTDICNFNDMSFLTR
jgi:hypothetical protein